MEFKNKDKKSSLTRAHPILISKEDVELSFVNAYLHDIHSHFIVSRDGKYDDAKSFDWALVPERIQTLKEAFDNGHTIVVKDMENWNLAIINRCRDFDGFTDVHMYVSPVGATGFGWHTDDKDVYVHMQIGTKIFEVEEPNGAISRYSLEPGDVLFIPYGARHRAIATNVPSVHLGFGNWPQDVTVRDTYDNFPVELNLKI